METKIKPIRRDNFTLESNVVNIDSPVATYTLPKGFGASFVNDRNFMLLLPTVVHDVVSAAEDSANAIVVACPGIAWASPNVEDSIIDVEVYHAGTLQTSGVTVDHSAGTVTLTKTLAENDLVDVFYLFTTGQVSIRRISPQDLNEIYDTLFARGLRSVQEQNQVSVRTGLKLDKGAILPEKFRFAVYLKSSILATWKIATAGGAGTDTETGLGRFLFWADVVDMPTLREATRDIDPAGLVIRQMTGGE